MRYSPGFTQLMKKTILDIDLVDTGALYRSVEVWSQVDGFKIVLDCRSEDYIKYYITAERIAQLFSEQSGFSNLVEKELAAPLERAVEASFTSGVPVQFKPELVILFNGE